MTNESGAYNIPSLLPGPYKLTAELPGFRTQAFNAVQLGANIAARYNFVLQVGAADQTVEVTAESTALIAESSPTIGQVLTENKVRDLPLVSNNVLDLMKTMPGVQGGIYSANTTFAGISASAVNTTRDGLSVQEGRYAYGVGSTTLINPDMVGEFRVILAPVDAETGRGNGQVQITTRSGTNQLRGSAVWNVRNSALDANTWANNKTGCPRRVDSGCSELAERARIFRQSQRTDQEKQNVLLLSVGPAVRTRSHADAAGRVDGLCQKRHLPILGRLSERQPQHAAQRTGYGQSRHSSPSTRLAIRCSPPPIRTERHTPDSFAISAFLVRC